MAQRYSRGLTSNSKYFWVIIIDEVMDWCRTIIRRDGVFGHFSVRQFKLELGFAGIKHASPFFGFPIHTCGFSISYNALCWKEELGHIVSVDSPIRLKIHQVKPAAKTLARAFHDDPVFVYFFPKVSSREDKSTQLFQMLISYSIHYGEAYYTTNLGGVAAWLPSDKLDMSVWGMIRSGVVPLLLALGRHSIKRILHFDKYSVATHKRNAPSPHLVLQPLGVDPLVQGKGYASLLLRTKFERLDAEGISCYVDTQTEKNVSMYKHYGFKVVEEFQIPDTSFNNWVMVREPRATH